MQPSLFPQIEQVRRRLGRRRLAAATCWALATAIVAVLALGGLDRALVIQDLPGRVLLSALSAGVAIAILRRWFRAITARDMSSLELAFCVERRYPELRDVVTSALDFSLQEADDPTAGSASLRRAVVLQAATAVEEVDWHQFVPLRPLQRAALACAGVLVVLASLTWWTPQAVGTGLVRLVNPLSPAEWPRENHLEFVDPPAKLAAGDDLVLQLRDARGLLPADVQMHYRTWQGEKWSEQSEPLTVVGHHERTQSLKVRRANIGRSLEYRATGGDHHTMPWQTLEIVPSPRIESLAVTVHHPAYTGLGRTLWKEGGRVLEGSRLVVRGETDRPIASVALGNDDGRRLPGSVESEGREFRVSLDCTDPQVGGVYFFEFITLEQVTTHAARRLAIEVTLDESPQVNFLEPTAEQLTLVPWATLPLVIEARDDLAVESIELVVRRSDRSEQGDQVFSLWQRPLWQGPDVDAPQRHRLEYLWQLAPLNLQPGSVVEVHARASDFRPTTGQTLYPLRIAIATEDDLLRELGEREAVLLDVVERTLIQQRELHVRTADWTERPAWSPEVLANEGHAVLFGQRQIADALVDAADSAARSVEFMLRTVSRNHLDRPEFSDRLYALRDWLGELADGPLPQIDQSLGDLVRLSQRGNSPVAESELRPIVAATVDRQEQVIAILEKALDSLSVGNAMGRIERQLAALSDDQWRLAEHCHEFFLDWLSNSPTVSDRELELSASGQRQLARRLAELTVRMATLSDELADRQPQLAARLTDVTALARELGLQMTMRFAAEQLVQRRFGRATSLQRQAVEDLRRLYDRLARRDAANEAQQQSQFRGGQSKQSSPPKPSASKPGTSPATGASPTTSQSGDLAASLAATGELVKDLWGHLPERQRQQILQPLSEDFLPKYATEIEEYFRALADPNRRPPESP